MHELAVAQSLTEMASQAAQRAGARRVSKLTCRIGTLRQLDVCYLGEAFALAGEGTPCAGASLHVEVAYPRAACRLCGQEYVVESGAWQCPNCGAPGQYLGGGDELELLTLDAEDQNEEVGRHADSSL